MAHKRAFSKTIVETDAFQDMSQTAQLLYFYLNMQADDDGFVSNPKRIMRTGGFGDDDFKILLAKRFLLMFESGVVVIKHWLIHNTIRKDRYVETSYLKEKETLQIKENNAYTDHWQPNGNQLATQDKIREDKIKENKIIYTNDFKETFDTKAKTFKKLGITYKPTKKTSAQDKAVTGMKLLDYFRDKAMEIHRVSWLNRKEDKNQQMIKKTIECFDRFGTKEKCLELIDWYLAGYGEWNKYEPTTCFMSKTYQAFENKDVEVKNKKSKQIYL